MIQVAPHDPANTTMPPLGTFSRVIYGFYFRSSGVRHFIARRLRPAGVGLALGFVMVTGLGLGYSRGPIYQTFSMAFVFILIGLLWASLRRGKLEARRETPRYATAGEPLRYAVWVKNSGNRRLARAWLAETPPDTRPKLLDFTTLQEPGEEERNKFDQIFAYYRWQWLMMCGRLFVDGDSLEEICLKPGGTTRVFIDITPMRRGVIRLHDLRVLLPDPCGLFQKCVPVKAPPATVLVLPRRYPLPKIELPGGAAFKITGETTTNSIGTSGEFVGLREYKPGDPLRLIHWKSWARTGRPIVKELEDTFYPRYGLVLDTCCTATTDAAFEDAVSVAASFAAAIDTRESLLDLMFVKNEAHIVTAGRGLARTEKLLEVLAGVTPDKTADFRALASLVLRYRDDLTSCLIVLNGWDEVREEFLATLTRAGIICAPILIGNGPPPANMPGHWLESGHIARDLKRLPACLRTLK